MFKSMIMLQCVLIFLVTLSHGKPHRVEDSSSSPTAVFIKPSASVMRRLNPLKLLFTVAYVPQNSSYSIEWNFPLLESMLIQSAFVPEEDTTFFIKEFSSRVDDYANWSEDKHHQLERFTEKYFSIYKSPKEFLPLRDCPSLTHSLMDEMINDLQPNLDERKRNEIRSKAAKRLCNSNQNTDE